MIGGQAGRGHAETGTCAEPYTAAAGPGEGNDMKCPYCGSERIESEIAWGKAANAGNVGLKFRAKLGLIGVAQVYSDLCLDCKSIIRSYIKEDTDKKWDHVPGSIGTR